MLVKLKVKSLIIAIIYNAVLLTFSYFIDRFFQMLMFILFFSVIQNCFRYRFHADTIQPNPIKSVKLCKLITVAIELTYLALCKDLDISVYSNLALILLIAFINCILELSLENYFIRHDVLKDKSKLIELCNARKITKVACNRLILKYIEGYTYQEIADLECVDIETIKKSISRSRKKLFMN